ncbi:MAG: type II toxin-antitoxin system VapB family antitoxin [Rhodocyclaceae bacterium]|nr:type II toxin-antitoxin system VapB family antitoxin [Rhodocyclaceae bacterium]
MRTNIDIDDTLMTKAMKAGGFTTKKETVEEGLRLLAARAAIADIRKLRGKIKWMGSLNEMRQDRVKYAK